ncbi:hypothetical protein [Ureaplasma zalophigenitalium]|uniref:Uncharacterized protein n=1 Tax=Ureaplasma zalophigenitalium TaxID=907723 RepID=A0ABT3BQ52_9BACT|nr:hypothetical protein [Ureaplasma zalophigenitalium]MCV3754257.1 hypothetical protein [Ureaplasma zalophigenitalium]
MKFKKIAVIASSTIFGLTAILIATAFQRVETKQEHDATIAFIEKSGKINLCKQTLNI